MTATSPITDRIIADGVALARRAAHTMAEQDQFAARYLTAGQQAAYESLCRDLRAGRTPHSGVEAAVAKIVRS